jgi:hypothetical protein
MLGYAQLGHSYRLLEISTKSVIVCTHVRFEETSMEPPSHIPFVGGDIDAEGFTTANRLFDTRNEEGPIDNGNAEPENAESEQDEDGEDTPTDTDSGDDEHAHGESGGVEHGGVRFMASGGVGSQGVRPHGESQLRRSERRPKPVTEWWRVDTRGPVNYAFNIVENSQGEQKRQAARDKEYNTLMEYHTWDLVPPPLGRKIVGSKWVDTIKRDGTYKSRLVCQGYSQVEGIDYFNTFSPVAKPTMVRIVFMVAAIYDMELDQIDVRAAYLNADMDVPIYMRQPKGYEKGNLVCKLNKALYGTKQAGRAWGKLLKGFLVGNGFTPSIYDPCCFTMQCERGAIIMVVWVDDISVAYHRNCSREYEKFRTKFRETFQLQELGPVRDYLGMMVTRNRDQRELRFNCCDNINRILKQFNMEYCEARDIPLPSGAAIGARVTDCDVVDKPFKSLVGCLLYPSQWCRPDLAYAVGALSQVMAGASQEQWNMGLNVVKYLKGARNLELTYRKHGSMDMIGYADSDFANDKSDGKSIYGYAVFVGGNVVSWRSKKAQTTATSTTIAEL